MLMGHDGRKAAMGIRKTASAGQITEVEQADLSRTASREGRWGPDDEEGLAAENEETDQG
jgi:hypothetical protein